jgi:hypothetical protein
VALVELGTTQGLHFIRDMNEIKAVNQLRDMGILESWWALVKMKILTVRPAMGYAFVLHIGFYYPKITLPWCGFRTSLFRYDVRSSSDETGVIDKLRYTWIVNSSIQLISRILLLPSIRFIIAVIIHC